MDDPFGEPICGRLTPGELLDSLIAQIRASHAVLPPKIMDLDLPQARDLIVLRLREEAGELQTALHSHRLGSLNSTAELADVLYFIAALLGSMSEEEKNYLRAVTAVKLNAVEGDDP